MPATVQQFIEGLGNPTRELCNALQGGSFHPIQDGDGAFVRALSSHLEAEVESGGRRYLIALPRHAEATLASARVAARLRGSAIFGRYTLLEEGFCYTDSLGHSRRCSVVVEELPAGEQLDRLLPMGCCAASLIRQLKQLEQTLAHLGMAHNNLKAENLYLTEQGKRLLIRPHRLSFEGPTEEDRLAFRALEALIREYDLPDAAPLTPEPTPQEEGLIAVGPMCDERILVCRDGLYGYMDCEGRVVIEPQYRWADDFREGRAEVESHEGFGVIDKEGRPIIAARFDGVDYDDMEGVIHVRLGEEWMLFGYNGKPL